MTKVFIVRPFGNRKVLRQTPGSSDHMEEDFNFDLVEEKLIRPAMSETGLTGGTTGEVFVAGDIREDMFSALLLDDIVIADITIHNANVFYELGIRHALREKRTILIKCPGYAETPFDILGYRYVSYSKDDPAAAIDALTKTINDTLAAQDRTDSPVFKVLPQLQPQDPEKYLAVPQSFADRLTIASAAKDWNKVNDLIAEAGAFSWKRPAYRLIGEALFKANSYAGAMPIWEDVLDSRPFDREANDRLSTIYQRLAREVLNTSPLHGEALLAKSDLAIRNLIDNSDLTAYERAEAYSLSARNAKTRWLITCIDGRAESLRQQAALQSTDLDASCRLYERGFRADLNHYYSGINILGLLTIQLTLARRYPDIWELGFPSRQAAADALRDVSDRIDLYSPVVRLSIDIARKQAATDNRSDLWANVSEAHYMCLTSTNPNQVQFYYARALTGATEQNKDAEVSQLKIYEALGVLPDNVAAAIAGISTP
jgi:hypothetical protein